MGIIKKRADELQPGDIFTQYGDRRVVLYTVTAGGPNVVVYSSPLGMRAPSVPPPAAPCPASTEFNVEGLDVSRETLTPAQQYADELADLLEQAIASDTATNHAPTPAWARLARELLDKIDPPVPPTLAEALAALADLAPTLNPTEAAHAVLDRARRAGLLPKNGGA